jgi:hypothetical protein
VVIFVSLNLLFMPYRVANLGDFSPKNANLEIFGLWRIMGFFGEF